MRMLQFWRKLFARATPSNPGGDAERRAADWLCRRGFAIVARNWRSPRDRRDELDLVCRDGDVLVFVEVKARAAAARVPGYHAVDARKKRVLLRATRTYLAGMSERPHTIRFDVVELVLPAQGEPEILHFENVPLFPKYWR